MNYRIFLSLCMDFVRQYILPMEQGYTAHSNLRYAEWHLLGYTDETEREECIQKTTEQLKKLKGKPKQILELSTLFTDLNFLSKGDMKYKKAQLIEKLSAIDEKFPREFEAFLQQAKGDNPFPNMRYRELSDEEKALFQDENQSEWWIIEDIAEDKYDFFAFEMMSNKDFVLHCIDFMRTYVISLTKSCPDLSNYLDVATDYLNGKISRKELEIYDCEIHKKIEHIKQSKPLYIVRIYTTVSYFLWSAFLDDEEEEGQQDPSYSYFLDDLRRIQHGLMVQLFMPIFKQFNMINN